jgi:transposase
MASDKMVGRRRYSDELKAEVMAECDAAVASLAKVAIAPGINANLVHRWRQLAREGDQATVAKPLDMARIAQSLLERGQLRPRQVHRIA